MELKEEKLSRAISAYSRRRILRLLAKKELTVSDVVKATGQSMSLASRHLKLLYDLEFVDVRRKGTRKFYRLKIKEMVPLLQMYDQVIEKI